MSPWPHYRSFSGSAVSPADWARFTATLLLLLRGLFCTAGIALILMDVHIGGIWGTSNGRFVSLMDSVSSLCDYRSQEPFPPPSQPGDTLSCGCPEDCGTQREPDASSDQHGAARQTQRQVRLVAAADGSAAVANRLTRSPSERKARYSAADSRHSIFQRLYILLAALFSKYCDIPQH